MTDRAVPVCVTMGEPAGIGGEIALKAWMSARDSGLPPFVMIDNSDRLAACAASIGLHVPIRSVADTGAAAEVFDDALPVLPIDLPARPEPGFVDPRNAAAVIRAIELGVAAVQSGAASALVTNPIQKAALYDAGFNHPGHTEFLSHLASDDSRPVMMLIAAGLRVVPTTIHIPLAQVSASLSTELIEAVGRTTAQALTRDFGIARPRLAVAALNPHAGENGALGREEIEIIAPAVERLRAQGIETSGPAPADSLFHETARAGYDAAICMYHDQALIPLKSIDFWGGVNVTLGLPFVRTSPDHGTALDIAGRGIANPESLIHAIRIADRIARNRAAHDGEHAT